MFKFAEIADTVYFWFAANLTTGAAGDGATPTYVVRLAGAAAGAAKVASGTPTLLSHADYSDGSYEIAIDTTAWSAGEYAVFCSLTISTVNPNGFVGSFKLRAAGASALNVNVVSQDNIDFGALQKASITAAVPTAADIKTAVEADGSKLDHLWETTEDDGGVRRFTENALEEAPSSGSAPTVEQIRAEIDSNSTQLAAILEDTGTTIPALINADSGAGTIQHTYTMTDSADGTPIDGVEVWVSTDAAGVNVIASGYTNSSGIVIFMLDAGTYYFWRKLSGYNFTNPDTEIVA